MDFFTPTLEGMISILNECGETDYADNIKACLKTWTSERNPDDFTKSFSKGGYFENFAFANSEFTSDEQRFWITQMFSCLVAMGMQLARFEKSNRLMTIDFMRRNFGHQPEVISGLRCADCGAKEINTADIDRYITPCVISSLIVDGLEAGNLDKNVASIIDLSSKAIADQRAEAAARAANSNVSVADSRTPMTRCKHCGSTNIVKCRFLKSLKKPAFVALSK